VVERILGKAEVDSSILSGGTISEFGVWPGQPTTLSGGAISKRSERGQLTVLSGGGVPTTIGDNSARSVFDAE
jgi:hypothetical protein